jgi:hypothetical protein
VATKIVAAAVFWMGVTSFVAPPAYADEDMDVGTDLTGVDGSDQANSPADVVPDLTVESPHVQQPIPHRAQFLRLVGCEASGDWHSASNPRYKGGLQFDPPTWARHGGLAFAWRADFATPEEQMIVAERTLNAQGWGAWPRCSRILGLR